MQIYYKLNEAQKFNISKKNYSNIMINFLIIEDFNLVFFITNYYEYFNYYLYYYYCSCLWWCYEK